MVDLVSFYMGNVPKRAVAAQRAVFEHFGLTIKQILTPYPHGESMTRYMNGTTNDVIFFDLDAIPLSSALIGVYERFMAEGCLVGVAQSANGYFDPNDRDHIYAAPSCLGLSQAVYTKLGRPWLGETSRSDVAEEMTRVAEASGEVPIKLLWPTESEDQEWALGSHGRYGHGTTYEGLVYHAFQIRMNADRFIKKCETIVGRVNEDGTVSRMLRSAVRPAGRPKVLPPVTITIATYARTRWLEQALFSALMQEYDGELRVLIFNDCPQQTLVFDDPQVTIINLPTTFPTLGDKRNAMVKSAQTEWLAFLDDDDFLLPWHCQSRIEEAVRVGKPLIDPTVSWFFQRPSMSVVGGTLIDMVLRWEVAFGMYPSADVGEDRRFRDAVRSSIGEFYVADNRSRPSYVYCWGNGVYHVSGQGDNGTGGARFRADAAARMKNGAEPTGRIVLEPHQGFDPAWAIEAMKKPFPYEYRVETPL